MTTCCVGLEGVARRCFQTDRVFRVASVRFAHTPFFSSIGIVPQKGHSARDSNSHFNQEIGFDQERQRIAFSPVELAE